MRSLRVHIHVHAVFGKATSVVALVYVIPVQTLHNDDVVVTVASWWFQIFDMIISRITILNYIYTNNISFYIVYYL